MKKNIIDIKSNVSLGENVKIGSFSVIGQQSIRTEKKSTFIGDNTEIQPGSIIFEGGRIGKNCLIGANAVIREKCIIGDNTIIATIVALERDCKIGSYVTIATQSHITPETNIEDYVFLGAQVVTMNTKYPLPHVRRERDYQFRRGVSICPFCDFLFEFFWLNRP